MPRDFKIYLDDILEACGRIKSYTSDLTPAQFAKDAKTVDAVVRNLDTDILWDIIQNKLPALTERVRKILK